MRGARGAEAVEDAVAKQDNVEQPRTDEDATSAEGREQPEVKPDVEQVEAPVADAPDTTTTKKQVEDPTKQEKAE